MKAILLAGGKSSRLKSYTENIPKCLLKVNNKPIIQYQLEALIENNIKDLVIVIGYKGFMIKEFIDSNYNNLNVTYVANDDYTTTGTAYGWWLARNQIKNEKSIIHLNADLVFLPELIKRVLEHKGDNVICIDKEIELNDSMEQVILNDFDEMLFMDKRNVPKANGKAVGVAKFSNKAINFMLNKIKEHISLEYKNRHFYGMIRLILEEKNFVFHGLEIGNSFFREVNTVEDYEKTKNISTSNPLVKKVVYSSSNTTKTKSTMEKIGAKLPDSIYTKFAVPYWKLSSKNDIVSVKKANGIYHIIGNDYDFWVSYARDSRPTKKLQFQNHGFERFYKIQPNDVVLDLGSYYGAFAYTIHNRCKHIYCIEPDPIALKSLKLNIEKIKNATIINKAISNKKGKAKFYVGKSSSVSSLFYSVANPDRKQKEFIDSFVVEVDTIDNIFKNIKVDVIKADIEGAEIDMLLGATKILKNVKYAAIASYHVLNGESTTKRVCKLLKDNGFNTAVAEEPMDISYGWKPELGLRLND